ncbi:MAG: hypothetical protein JW776_14140 [Candidatus Lokiarchaeota archaeon]|nr:hypothetical protein [Candidatus Lokiarchaeota archaeon]
MNDFGVNSKNEKIKKLTDALWRFWWLVLFLFILPIGIAGIIGFSVNRILASKISWINEFSYSLFLLLIPIFLLVFLIPYEKYRKHKFFISTNLPTYKHVIFFTLIPLIPQLYYQIVKIILVRLNIEYSIFFGDLGLFNRILTPMVSIITIGFYLYTRKPSSAVIFSTTIKTIDKIVIILYLTIQSISIVIFPNRLNLPFLILNALLFTVFMGVFHFGLIKNSSTEEKLPLDFKIRLLFNICTVMGLICSILLIGWIFWLYYALDIYIIIMQTPLILILSLKGMIIYSYNQVLNTQLSDTVKSQKSLPVINSFLAFILILVCICFFIYSWNQLIFEIITIAYLIIIFIWIGLDYRTKIISTINAKIASLLSSLLLISLITIIIPIAPIYQITIGSVLLYLDLALLSYWRILDRNKIAVIHAFLFSAIILEVFYTLWDLVVVRLESLLTNPSLIIWLRVFLFSFAFLVSTILSLFRVVLKRFKGKVSRFIKWVFLVVHFMLGVAITGIVYLTLGKIIVGVLEPFWIFFKILAPLIIYIPINVGVFKIYYKYGIYSRRSIINIDAYSINLISLLLGISAVIFLRSVGSYLILGFLFTISIILHLYLKKKNQFLEDLTYQKWMVVFHPLMLFEINIGLLLIFIQNLSLSVSLSIFTAMLITQVVLFVFRKLKFLFGDRFAISYNILSIMLQGIFLPIYLDSIIDAFIINLGAELTTFLSFLCPITIISIYLLIFFTYSLRNGILTSKIAVKFTNLLYFSTYIMFSLIPTYVLQILQQNPITGRFLSEIFYFSASLLVWILFDSFTIHGMIFGPKKWILLAIEDSIFLENPTKKKIFQIQSATGIELIFNSENEVKIDDSVVSKYLNRPELFYEPKNTSDLLLGHFSWVLSVFVNLISVLYVIQTTNIIQISFGLALFLPGLLSYVTLILLYKFKIVKNPLKQIFYNVNFIYNIFSGAVILFPIIQQPLISILGITNASLVALVCSAAFAFSSFHILKKRLVSRTPGFYYITLFILWVLFSTILIISISFTASVLSSVEGLENTFLVAVFSNSFFIVFLTLSFITLAFLGAIGYIFKYNTVILQRVPIYTFFTEEELKNGEISKQELEFLEKRGFASKKTEDFLKERVKLLKTFKFRHYASIFTYMISPISLFILGILAGNLGYALFTRSLLLEAFVAYLLSILLGFTIDNRWTKYVNRELNNQIRCIVWIIFQVIISISVALLLELTWYGRILLFLQIYSILMPPLNYFLKNAGFKVIKWTERTEEFTKLLMVITSTAYLANLSLSTFFIHLHSSTTKILGYVPFLLLIVHIIFHITYFRKETSLKRFYRTYNLSFPFIMISLYLIRYQTQIYELFPPWVPVLSIISPILSVILLWFALFYYYSMVKQFNIILNFFYQFILIFIGSIYILHLVIIPLSTQYGYGYLHTDQILVSCAITFIGFYYIRKAAYFEIYKGFLQEEPVRFRSIGIIAGILRTVGVILFVGSILRLVNVIFNIAITRWTITTLNLWQLSLINSIFNWSLASFLGLFLFLFFLKGYFKNFDQYSYNSRFIIRIFTVLAASFAVGMTVILYETTYLFALPPILVGCYFWLYFIQKKNPYRANLTIGAAKSILVFFFVFWTLHQYIFRYLFGSILISSSLLTTIELLLSAGITGFVFSRTFQNIILKGKNTFSWILLVSSVSAICYSCFLSLDNLGLIISEPTIELDFTLNLTLTLNFGILLLYLAVAVHQWKISKKIWDVAWWLWLFLPIINFTIIYQSIRGIDTITESFFVFGLEVSGSVLLTIIISTLLYLPIILTKFQKAYKWFFFLTWIEAIPVWIWLAPNIFRDPNSIYLSPLFVTGLSLISAVPLLFSLKYWRIIAGVWILIALINAMFLSILIDISFIPDMIMDVFIHITVYGLYIIIFISNPLIRESWKNYDYGILVGYLLMIIGASVVVFGFSYVLTLDYLYAISISAFFTGIIMISGRYVKLIHNRLNPYAVLLMAAGIGLGSFLFLYEFKLFPVNLDFTWTFLNQTLQNTVFPFSIALISSGGIILLAQARQLINKKHWRLMYAFFAVGIGVAIGSVLDSLLDLPNPLFAAIVTFWSVLSSYPTFRYKKPIFWGLFPLFIASLSVYGFEQLNIGFNWSFHTIIGVNYTFWIFSFSLASLIIHKVVSLYFMRKYLKVTRELTDMGISDYKTLPFDDEDDVLMIQQKEIAVNLIQSLEILPQFYTTPRKIASLYSLFLSLSLYSLSYFISFITPIPLLFQIEVFIFLISVSTFINLAYIKRNDIFQNLHTIRFIRFIATNLLYASILYGIIILNRIIIPIIPELVSGFSLTANLTLSLNIALDSIFFYVIFIILSQWIAFYNKLITLMVKIISWITFITAISYFLYAITSFTYIVVLIVTIGSYLIVIHLRNFHKHYAMTLRLLTDTLSSSSEKMTALEDYEENEYLEAQSKVLGIDSPIPIPPPLEIHYEDLASEADFMEVKEVLDAILPLDSSEMPFTADSLSSQISSKKSLSDTLELRAKQEKRSKILYSIIGFFDAWIKQGIILELSYLASLIFSNMFPNINEISLYHVYVFRLFMFLCIATTFYNFKKLIPANYRLVVVQILSTLFMVTTILTPFSVISVYGTELNLIIDRYYWSNIMFLVSITIFLLLLQIQLVIRNYVETKNVHLRQLIIDKWNDVIQPMLLILAAYIIANIISINTPLITRLIIAALILFTEAIIEKYILKIFNRLTRARLLLYSWILINILGIIQVVQFLPTLKFSWTLGILMLLILAFLQYITLYLYYSLKNEKIIRTYNINPIVLNHFLFRMMNRHVDWAKKRSPKHLYQQYEHSEKLITYNDFIKPKYNFMALITYILISALLSALIYESSIKSFILGYITELKALGVSINNLSALWNHPTGLQLLILSGLPIIIAIILSFGLFFQDKFTFRILHAITRDIFLILLWVLISGGILFYSLALLQLWKGITYSNLLTPGMIAIISIAQYYTIYLITDIAIHSTKNIDKLESEFSSINLETMSHSDLMELLAKIEPKRLKIIKNLNMILGIIIYGTLSVIAYLIVYIFSQSIILSLSGALLIVYGQSELNYYILKAFPSKISFYYSLMSWICFSVLISFSIPIVFWGNNPEWVVNSDLNIVVYITNGFFVSTCFCIFSILSFATLFILKRKYSDYTIKFQWMKYLRIGTYFTITAVVFVLFIPTSIMFASFLSSLVLYLEMVGERYFPIFMNKITRLIRSISAFIISIILCYWIYSYMENTFNFEIALAVSILLFTILSQLIFNPWEYKKVAGPIFWGFISAEIGYLISNIVIVNNILLGIASGLILMGLYPIIFEFSRFVDFFRNIVENIRIFYQKIIYFFKNFWINLKNFYTKNKIWLTLIMVSAMFTGLLFGLRILLPLYQAMFISASIASTFLFPIFITPKALKDEKSFSRMVYYSAIIYVFANIAIFSFVKINIIWFLLSLVLFSSILLVVIYRQETLYNLSVRWRLIGLIITILSAVVLVSMVVLYVIGLISIKFF